MCRTQNCGTLQICREQLLWKRVEREWKGGERWVKHSVHSVDSKLRRIKDGSFSPLLYCCDDIRFAHLLSKIYWRARKYAYLRHSMRHVSDEVSTAWVDFPPPPYPLVLPPSCSTTYIGNKTYFSMLSFRLHPQNETMVEPLRLSFNADESFPTMLLSENVFCDESVSCF